MNRTETLAVTSPAAPMEQAKEGFDITSIRPEQQIQLQAVLMNMIDLYVHKEYLSELELADVREMTYHQKNIIPGENFRLYCLDTLPYADAESIPDRIQNIFGALSQDGNSVVMLINGGKDSVKLYIGVTDTDSQNLAGEQRLLRSALDSAFPGVCCTLLKTHESKELIRQLFPEETPYPIAAVPGSQIEPSSGNSSAYSIEELIDAMKYKPFTAVILSQSIRHDQLVKMRRNLESLYSSIAPLQRQDITLTQNENKSYGINLSETISKSYSKTVGSNISHTSSTGENSSITNLPDHREEDQRAAKNSLIGVGIAAVSALLTATSGGATLGLGAITSMLPSLFYGRSIGDALNNLDTMDEQKEPDQQITEGYSRGESDTVGSQESETESDSQSQSRGKNLSAGIGSSKGLQMSYTNKAVVDLLELIDEQIAELTAAERNGAFCAGAYFIAGDEETAVTAANVYRSVVTSRGQAISPLPVYCWSSPEKVKAIGEYLRRGLHPVFTFDTDHTVNYPDVTVGQLIRIQDIPFYFCLPKRTLKGLSVEEHAIFPRDIVFKNESVNGSRDDLCEIGSIYYMGKPDKKNPVAISMNELRKHLFVAGTTGSGKSNFCYHLIDKLTQHGKKVMIIEPAKGEYKKVFGGRKDFCVFGTNAGVSRLLRINPFAFPIGITIDEHIEALMGIFSNAWPMYSAMPAVLKEALETIYREKGFDMEYQTRTGKESFPSFSDLLEALPRVIKNSEYSKEVQGNYIGALVTRVKSLTNGIYNSLFCQNEIEDEILFDNNVIVDISRIRSDETKALIMGILVTRLSEYRECSGKMNSPLNHITLLEEAHHLLKAHQSVSAEGVSAGAASIEMISNAIAEMRTYGEGFVIADQSPASMDKSVMRNTFTKVFFNLPETEDRIVAANSLGLNEQQQAELGRISTGVSVVYHRAWVEPVLVMISYFSEKNMIPYCHESRDILSENRQVFNQSFAVLLYHRMASAGKQSSYDEALAKVLQNRDYYWLGDKEQALKETLYDRDALLKEKVPASEIARAYALCFDFKKQLQRKDRDTPIDNWIRGIKQEIINTAALSEDETEELIGLLLFNARYDNAGLQKMYVDFKSSLSKAKDASNE